MVPDFLVVALAITADPGGGVLDGFLVGAAGEGVVFYDLGDGAGGHVLHVLKTTLRS
jgi:hypothetical protein